MSTPQNPTVHVHIATSHATPGERHPAAPESVVALPTCPNIETATERVLATTRATCRNTPRTRYQTSKWRGNVLTVTILTTEDDVEYRTVQTLCDRSDCHPA